jgi:hypothetical protein
VLFLYSFLYFFVFFISSLHLYSFATFCLFLLFTNFHLFLKSSTFWDITPYNPLKLSRHFGGTLCPHLQDRRILSGTPLFGADFHDKRRSLSWHRFLTDSGHGVSLHAGVAESFLRVFKTQQARISDRAVTHAGNRWLSTAAVRVTSCGICGEQNGSGAGFSPSTSIFPSTYSDCSTLIIIHNPGWYSRPTCQSNSISLSHFPYGLSFTPFYCKSGEICLRSSDAKGQHWFKSSVIYACRRNFS